MKAALIYGDGAIKVTDVPDLTPGPYEALVRIEACSICNGTDRKLLEGKFRGNRNYPGVLGHESVGVVVETGDKVRSFHVGDRVFRPGAVYKEGSGPASYWGGFAEYGLVADKEALISDNQPVPFNARMQQVIPFDIDPVHAAVLITYKETLSWLQGFGLLPKESVLIWGTGPVGVSFARNAKLMGAYPVIVAGRRDEALCRAKSAGADVVFNVNSDDPVDVVGQATSGRGVDKAIEAVGNYQLIKASLPLLAPGGQVGLYGVPPRGSESLLDLSALPGNAGIRALPPDEPSTHRQVLDYYRLGVIDPSADISHVLPLAEIEKGFELLARKEAFKVVITMA